MRNDSDGSRLPGPSKDPPLTRRSEFVRDSGARALISLSKESGVLAVNERRKLKIFAAVSGVVSVAALVQAFLTDGSGKVTLITLGALGIVGIGMLMYAMQDRTGWRRNG